MRNAERYLDIRLKGDWLYTYDDYDDALESMADYLKTNKPTKDDMMCMITVMLGKNKYRDSFENYVEVTDDEYNNKYLPMINIIFKQVPTTDDSYRIGRLFGILHNSDKKRTEWVELAMVKSKTFIKSNINDIANCGIDPSKHIPLKDMAQCDGILLIHDKKKSHDTHNSSLKKYKNASDNIKEILRKNAQNEYKKKCYWQDTTNNMFARQLYTECGILVDIKFMLSCDRYIGLWDLINIHIDNDPDVSNFVYEMSMKPDNMISNSYDDQINTDLYKGSAKILKYLMEHDNDKFIKYVSFIDSHDILIDTVRIYSNKKGKINPYKELGIKKDANFFKAKFATDACNEEEQYKLFKNLSDDIALTQDIAEIMTEHIHCANVRTPEYISDFINNKIDMTPPIVACAVAYYMVEYDREKAIKPIALLKEIGVKITKDHLRLAFDNSDVCSLLKVTDWSQAVKDLGLTVDEDLFRLLSMNVKLSRTSKFMKSFTGKKYTVYNMISSNQASTSNIKIQDYMIKNDIEFDDIMLSKAISNRRVGLIDIILDKVAPTLEDLVNYKSDDRKVGRKLIQKYKQAHNL